MYQAPQPMSPQAQENSVLENVQKIDTIVMFSNWQIEPETEVNGNFRIRNVTALMRTTKARIKRV